MVYGIRKDKPGPFVVVILLVFLLTASQESGAPLNKQCRGGPPQQPDGSSIADWPGSGAACPGGLNFRAITGGDQGGTPKQGLRVLEGLP